MHQRPSVDGLGHHRGCLQVVTDTVRHDFDFSTGTQCAICHCICRVALCCAKPNQQCALVCERPKPGCQLVRWSTREQLTTKFIRVITPLLSYRRR